MVIGWGNSELYVVRLQGAKWIEKYNNLHITDFSQNCLILDNSRRSSKLVEQIVGKK